MMISNADWKNYIEKLSSLDKTAGDLMLKWVQKNGFSDSEALTDYAYALVTKYGEGSAALAAEMYDAVAEMSGKFYPPAETAPTPDYEDVAKAVNGTRRWSQNEKAVPNTVSRMVKQAGADTTLRNAIRDQAEFAWVPNGDTCAFCITLASNGWQPASNAVAKGGHAEHIHPNCDCTFAIRFDKKSGVKGYDPEKYKRMYDEAEGTSSKDKINSMRRMKYQENRDRINAQKRAAYAERKGLSVAAGTLPENMKQYVPGFEARMAIIQEGINEARPIFVESNDPLYSLAYGLPEKEGFYTVVLHGASDYVQFKDQVIDADTLCAIIAQRSDYKKGTDIRLISCYTGSKDDGVANYIANKLKVTVIAPDKKGIINRNIYGEYSVYSGSDIGAHDGSMVPFFGGDKR